MENNSPESGSTTETNTSDTTSVSAPSSAKKSKTKTDLRKPQKKQTSKASIALPVVIILLFCISAAASVYLWQELNKQQILVQQSSKEKDQLSKQLAQLNQSLDNRLKRLESNSSEQSKLITTLDKLALFNTKELNRLHASNRADWLLAEAEYLLRLANQRLNIERDSQGAEAIMYAADKVLMEIEDPSIYPIRESLAQEILALQSVNKVDVQGMYLQIQAMINSLDTLNEAAFLEALQEIPEKKEQTVEGSQVDIGEAERIWNIIWKDLKKALVIRRLDEPVAPLLAPEQSYFLKQNLQLMLEQAGLALLNEDDQIFKQNINKATNWLSQYFVQSDPAIEAMKSNLAALSKESINRTLPDISESLRLLKTRIESMYRAHQLDKNTSLRIEREEQAAMDKKANVASDSTVTNRDSDTTKQHSTQGAAAL